MVAAVFPQDVSAMADILAGVSGTKHHAPLSQAQTLAMCQFLKDLHDGVSRQVQDLQRGLQSTDSKLDGTCASICVVQGGLERLRHDLFGTDGHVVTTKRAIERNAALCKSLQVLVEQAHESCEHLRVGQAKTNTNLQITKDNLTSKSEVLKKVGADVDKLLGVKHPDIDGKLVEVYQRIGNLDDFQTNLKKDIALTQAEVQQLHGHAEEADACLKEMRRSLSHHGQSLTKVSEKMDEMQENLEMTNGVVMQLHKSHEDHHVKIGQVSA